MTREEACELENGMRVRTLDRFVEPPHPDLEEYLGKIITVDKVDLASCGWVYSYEAPQPFAISEIECVVRDIKCIDDESIPYQLGDVDIIFREVRT